MKAIELLRQAPICDVEEVMTIFLMGSLRSILLHHHIHDAIITGLVEGRYDLYHRMAQKFIRSDIPTIFDEDDW